MKKKELSVFWNTCILPNGFIIVRMKNPATEINSISRSIDWLKENISEFRN